MSLLKLILLIFINIIAFKIEKTCSSLISDVNCSKQKCFEQFGCFSSENFIDSLKDLISSIVNETSLKELLSICPIGPDSMNITFYFFTQQTNVSQALRYNSTNEELRNTGFTSNRSTVFIIHGWQSGFTKSPWMMDQVNYFLPYDHNIIALDWSKPASEINYFNSAFNTQIVASIVVYFINRLNYLFGSKPQDYHLVGHSLGAHLSGFVGKNFTTDKIGHISGLDPAGPGFFLNNSETRLAKTDADLVVITHTSAGVFKLDSENPLNDLQLTGIIGLPDALGHFDFRPNGGSGQPGCETSITCSHSRATVLPIADRLLSSANSCQLIGYECDSYEEFTDGKCGDCGSDGHKCKPLEFNLEFWSNSSNTLNGRNTFPNNYYLRTNSSDPFCLFHYQIVINGTKNAGKGELKIKLDSDSNQTNVLTFKDSIFDFTSDIIHTHLYTSAQNLGVIRGATVEFKRKLLKSRICKRSENINIDNISINFMSHINDSIRKKYSAELIPINENQNEKSMKFIRK